MRGLLIAAFILLAIGGLLIAGFFYIGFYLSPQDPLQKSDAIVAISGGETDSRAREAIRLYKEGYAPVLIFSGAALDPDSPSNARTMRNIAIEAGVPQSAILLDELSANTTQNAYGVAEIVHANRYTKIILVTSPYHQRRAGLNFETALGSGVEIINHSTTDQNWRRTKWWDNAYSFNLTISELQKTLYVLLNRDSSALQPNPGTY